VFQFLGLGLGCLVVSAIAFAVFNAILGGDATFKQVFAIVAHTGGRARLPVAVHDAARLRRGTLSSATNLAVFLPFLDETLVSGPAARLDRSDFHLVDAQPRDRPRRPLPQATAPIAVTLLAVYVAIGVIIAAIKTARLEPRCRVRTSS
jgi:hypothetical protein